MTNTTTSLLNKLREDGWTVETDAETIYWLESFNRSVAAHNYIDPRDKGKRKPILISRGDNEILVEWDYGREDGAGWIAHDLSSGNIIRAGVSRFEALLEIAYHID